MTTTIHVKLVDLGSKWTGPCKKAVTALNAQFTRKGIDLVLSIESGDPVITVQIDPSIKGSFGVHGTNHTEADASSRRLKKSTVGLPASVDVSTPGGVRAAGSGILEVIAAHEFVHALGQEPHTSKLMAQTWQKFAGDSAAGDKLVAGSDRQPPILLADDTAELLQGIWN